jgi:diguanylate cyclase (GGDEF)-like protein/PAS domain S-box-containing protein
MSHERVAHCTAEILIADDTLESLRLLSQALAQAGYDIRSVSSGTLALNSVRAAHPDLILLDITMPDISGFEICQQLKADPRTRSIPIIFISALHETLDQVRAFDVGGADYVTKPFQIEEVLARVHNQVMLACSIKHISQLNAELEQRVQERTAALNVANQALQQKILEHQKVEQSLRESEEKFRQISEHVQAVFWLTDRGFHTAEATTVRYVSPAFEDIWGLPCATLYANPQVWLDSIHEDDRDRVATALETGIHQGSYDVEYRITRPDGSLRWIHDRGFPIYNEQGTIYRLTGLAADVTSRAQAELERDRVFNFSIDLLFIADSRGQLKRVNPSWQKTLSYSQTTLLGQSIVDLLHPDDRAEAQKALITLTQGTAINELEMRCRHRDGSYIWIAWNAVPFLQEDLIYGAGRNISQRKLSEAQLVYETLHDSLTGLANRACFMTRLELALKKQRRSPVGYFAVLFIDLDGFKSINDTSGHIVGDQLLVYVARLLTNTVREVDSVARLGGDEFTILLENISHLREVIDIAERIQAQLQALRHIQHQEIATSASIGIVIGTLAYQEVAHVLRDADIAMYRAKANGKACYEVFDQTMYAETLQRVEFETRLRRAIGNQELEIHYQPIIRLEDDILLEGLEVLLRWRRPKTGLISASEFIPIAEETGLINDIGIWVLEEAARKFNDWRALWPDFQHLYLSINISGCQLRNPSLLHDLDRVLSETQIPPHCLRFEITESSLIENKRIAAQLLTDIQQRGIRISLDDFGTGFSALSYLHQFPIDVLKIDRSFVELLLQGDREHNIVASIFSLSQTLGLETVAEGIETQQQLAALQALHCHAGQGYYFSPPMSARQLEAFLTSDCKRCPAHYLCFVDCHKVSA